MFNSSPSFAQLTELLAKPTFNTCSAIVDLSNTWKPQKFCQDIFIVWWRMVQSCASDWLGPLGMVVGRSGSSFLIQNSNRVALRTAASGNPIGFQKNQVPKEWKLVKRPCFESHQLNKAVAVSRWNCQQFTETSWKGADFHLNWLESGSHNDQLTVNCFMASFDRDHVTYASIIQQ